MSLACIGSFFSSHVYLFFHNKTSLCFGVSVSSFFFVVFVVFNVEIIIKNEERETETHREETERNIS